MLILEGTLYDALIGRDAPERFAVDLVALLAGLVDFRRDLQGGETFAIAWQEDRLPDGKVAGEPRLEYARLQLSERTIELVATSAAAPSLSLKTARSCSDLLRPSSVPGYRRYSAGVIIRFLGVYGCTLASISRHRSELKSMRRALVGSCSRVTIRGYGPDGRHRPRWWCCHPLRPSF